MMYISSRYMSALERAKAPPPPKKKKKK